MAGCAPINLQWNANSEITIFIIPFGRHDFMFSWPTTTRGPQSKPPAAMDIWSKRERNTCHRNLKSHKVQTLISNWLTDWLWARHRLFSYEWRAFTPLQLFCCCPVSRWTPPPAKVSHSVYWSTTGILAPSSGSSRLNSYDFSEGKLTVINYLAWTLLHCCCILSLWSQLPLQRLHLLSYSA